MKTRFLLPAALAVAIAAGGWLWWQGGGFGRPVSDAAARRYFNKIVAAAMAKDFDELCRHNGSVGTCEAELRVYCPTEFGSGGAPSFLKGEALEQACRESVPTEPPTIVSSRYRPARGGSVGGRILVVRGTDGRGKPYETDVMIFRDRRTYKATHAVFWSGDKFDD